MRYASQRRWFRGKARARKEVTIVDVIALDGESKYAIVLLQVEYAHGAPDTYVMPVAFAEDAEPRASQTMLVPALIMANVEVADVPGRGTVTGTLYDALCLDSFSTALLRSMRQGSGGAGMTPPPNDMISELSLGKK